HAGVLVTTGAQRQQPERGRHRPEAAVGREVAHAGRGVVDRRAYQPVGPLDRGPTGKGDRDGGPGVAAVPVLGYRDIEIAAWIGRHAGVIAGGRVCVRPGALVLPAAFLDARALTQVGDLDVAARLVGAPDTLGPRERGGRAEVVPAVRVGH